MAFTTLSTVSAYEEEKCLVRSGKDSMWRYLAKYVEILGKVCGDTKKQGSQGMIPRLPRADYIKRIALS